MDELHQRGKALEDHFFREKDKKLMEQLKADLTAKETREALAEVSGIKDEAVLDALVKVGISPGSLTSVSLIPLVSVAWADGKMEDKERKAILDAADQAGVVAGSAGYALLESWLNEQPDESLLVAWKDYVNALKGELDQAAFNQLKSSVLSRATDIAKSAGGFLGINAINDAESQVINELEHAF